MEFCESELFALGIERPDSLLDESEAEAGGLSLVCEPGGLETGGGIWPGVGDADDEV